MTVFYNENDLYAAQWLQNLMAEGLIPHGQIDKRSIKEISATDLAGIRRGHFFAGIAGWELALQLAGWPEDREVWTGSCPCQPFSVAGKQLGEADERHLWPDFYRLIRECRPATIFGEQVGGPDGEAWLDGVCTDLEAEGYACGATNLPAASVGVPHIRQRLWWVADADGPKRRQTPQGREHDDYRANAGRKEASGGSGFHGEADCRVADAELARRQETRPRPQIDTREQSEQGRGAIYCRDGKTRRVEPGIRPLAHGISARMGKLRAYGNAIVPQVAAEFIMAFMETEQS